MSSNKERAAELKAKGNAAFSAGNYEESIKHFSDAIEADPNDHIFYSNRSGAFASLKRNDEALSDANKCIEISPSFIKGYSRKGLALFQQGKFDEAKESYEEGLKKDPANSQLKEGLAEAERAISSSSSSASNPFGKLFGPDMWGKLMTDPVTKSYLSDPAFLQKMNAIQANPQSFGQYASDPKVSQALGVLFGLGANAFAGKGGEGKQSDFDSMRDEDEEDEEEIPASRTTETKKPESKPSEPVKPVKTASEADKLKDEGNAAFKAKKFDDAISFYEKASALDPTSMIYLNNISACHYEKKDYPATIESAKKAIEIGKENMASYKDIAKAWTRIGNAYYAEKKWDEAIEAYEKSNIEDYTEKAKEQIKRAQQHKKKASDLAYLDENKSEEEKKLGNELFTAGKFIDAIKHYTEALKRNPNNYKVYSNRAACYSKLMEWQRGLDDCEACLKFDPSFVKAYIRKGKIQHFLKQYHKALETFDAGLKLEPTSTELIQAKNETIKQMSLSADNPEEQKARAQEAMKDPEIRQILSDPTINKVLADMQENPASGQAAMRDPDIRNKINKLIAAGVLAVK